MTERWMHPPEMECERKRDGFDPLRAGEQYRLPRELSLAIWERVCADATDSRGRCDLEQAVRRFHEIAARIAARGGRLRPDVGRLTRVGVELDGDSLNAWFDEALGPRVPGRETLVAAETRRRALRDEPASTRQHADRAATDEQEDNAKPEELPGASEMRRALAGLQQPLQPGHASAARERPSRPEPSLAQGSRPDQPLAALTPEARLAQARGAFGHALRPVASEDQQAFAAGTSQRPDLTSAEEGRLPLATLDRMERAFGHRFDDVELHADSPEVPRGVQAFTRGRHIYLEPGAFEPETEHGEHVIAHELAHVAQQSQSSGPARPATRAALEADAHQAALAALAGRAASVNLFAPPGVALGFSKGESPRRQPAAPGAPSKPAQTARGSAPPPAPRAPRGVSGSPGGPGGRPAPTARPAATNSKAGAPVAAPVPGRGANGDGLLIPEAPRALTPAAAGRLQSTQASNRGVAAATTTLPTAQEQTTVARDAVVEPQAEQDGRAQHGVVTDVDDRPPPSPEIEEACAHIRQVIRGKRPPDEDKLVEAKPREMAQEAGKEMSAGVEQRAGTVRKGYDGIQNSPQGTPSTTPVPATLPPERAETQPVDAGAGTPDPVSSEDVSLEGDVAAQNQKIEEAGMNTEPGKLVQDGPIGDARGGAEELGNMAKTDPQKVLAEQAAAIAHAKGDMVALQAAAEKALADARSGAVSDMGKHTTGVKGSEEQQRAQAGEKMKGVFTRTQQAVDKLLQPLSGNAVARWDAGVAQLSSDFEASLAGVKHEIDERHSGVVGFVVGVSDTFTGLPESITIKYDIAEAKFADGCTSLIKDISRDVNAVIEDCKKLIELARKEIDDIVHSLPASLQTWAQGEAAKLGKQLDQLDQRVDQTQKSLNQDLIGRANGAVQEVRERVAQLRVEAGSFLAKIAAALVEFAKDPFKAIVNGLLRVLGIPPASFWSLVDKLGDVVGAIAKDPVKFGKTLISGAAQGFKQFFEHFPTHLKEILMGWLFGTLGTAGVPMPTDFSGPGIMPTVLGIMGIDSGMIMSMLGADGSDPAEMAEIHQELAGVLSGDPHALVALLRDHFDPASLIPLIKEAAMSFLIQALITQVAPRIAAMLVPGGAILQAVEAIFKVLMWVVSNAARIFTLIESLVATAGQAVAGNVSGVAAGVESGLVQIIVLVIDFLAGYIGLGGLGAKLKGVIMKVSGKLKGVLKKVLDAIKKRAKAKAKTKHDHHKPAADKKPDGDHAGPTHRPKQDDRDPQKAKDDAKDPRNHQRDPDDEDPRNHKLDADDKDPRNRKLDVDDKDPRNRKPDADDKDPRNHKPDDDRDPKKPKDDDDPKKKHENDLAEARRAARAAANRGWTAARNASEREVRSKAELKSILAREEHSTAKVKIDLEAQDRVKEWNVEAKARVDRAHASNTKGDGWIARSESGQPWYAARDVSGFNRKLIAATFHKLKEVPDGKSTDDQAEAARAQYDHKVRQGAQLAEDMQRQLDGQIRGLKAGIKMEPWSGVEQDHLIRTELSIAPNIEQRTEQVAAGSGGVDFKPISKPVAMPHSGQERVMIVDNGSKIVIQNGEGGDLLEQISKIRETVFSRGSGNAMSHRNRTGAMVLEEGIKVLWEFKHQLASIDPSKPLTSKQDKLLRQVLEKSTKRIRRIGETLDIPTLERAMRIEPIKQQSVLIDIEVNDAVKDLVDFHQLHSEVRRQLQLQRVGVNALTLDVWFSQVDMYRAGTEGAPHWFAGASDSAKRAIVDEARRRIRATLKGPGRMTRRLRAVAEAAAERLDKLRPRLDQRPSAPGEDAKMTAQEALDLITNDPHIKKFYLARHGNETKFARDHKKGIDAVVALWGEKWAVFKNSAGDVDRAILHNPDQVFGGFGLLPSFQAVPEPDQGADQQKWDEYEAYLAKLKPLVGVRGVNWEIGRKWRDRWRPVHDSLRSQYPKEGGHPLWQMDVVFDIKYGHQRRDSQ
jgi:hypothetical protein